MSVKQQIIDTLTQVLAPVHLEVINESDNHHVPPNSETHFKVIVASAAFEGQRLIGRHRAVNEALKAQFDAGLHALSMHTFTPEEWDQEVQVPNSPKCKG
ncbi:BolA family transcriptional regulator [Shewanella loihica]|uniref:Transcriptional regulator BolA n=1 Tax=Shewanella loihica (strain ATCC BAA-1088 / PV-4) TaxID=323850 RepID=A3QH01_SHELP|nr:MULTISPECIES: BolA family protein [Shewanella]ABO24749.1 transcriptional regulator BolA [Shewanella loihica PV-4]QYJ81549.1 BolA family transcriptional regulator [Shewanella aegiceratis]